MPYIIYIIKNKKIKNPKFSLRKINISNKKARFKSSFCGVFTIEAAIVLPLFIFASVTILSIFRFLYIQQSVQKAVNISALKTAVAADKLKEEMLLPFAIGNFFIELKNVDFEFENIAGQALGMSFSQTQVDGDYIDLYVKYNIKLPIQLLSKRSIPVLQRCRLHKWIGYQKNGEANQAFEWVYITSTGVVYHIDRACTHISLSVKTVSSSSIDRIMASSALCEICEKSEKIKENLYLTEEGRKYHYSLDCRGLKRTIYMIKLSEAGTRRPCSRCVVNQK